MEQLELIETSQSTIELRSTVPHDEYTEKLAEFFDFRFEGEVVTEIKTLPKLPETFGIGAIIGPSGSGKSTLLKSLNKDCNLDKPEWDSTKSVISHFDTPEDGIDKFAAVGFNSIPQMTLPYDRLSNGEQFRCDLARQLKNNAIIDEYTSVVNRDVAFSTSNAFRRYVTKNDLTGIVVASCHYDILEWLRPDWVFDTFTGNFYSGRYLQRPEIQIDIYRSSHHFWDTFKKHHYLSTSLNKASHCYVGIWKDNLVAFGSVLRYPSGTVKNGWRAHRTVVLPDFQGLGIGNRFSDAIGQHYVDEGGRYFSRTAHPSMGNYRERSDLWRATSKNRKLRKDIKHENVWKNHYADNTRICWSHEYTGLT